MNDLALFAAVGTPLQPDEILDRDALELHIADQWRGGMTGVLIGGTMGLMQLLSDATYRELIQSGTGFAAGHGEVMVGVGDTSFARTRDRIRFVNEQSGVDGVVCLSPFLWKFSQDELIDYFTALADVSRLPLYLYDLPALTGTKLSVETVLALARHPNIRGIKCATDLGWTRQLRDVAPDRFRVIFAQADLVDVLVRVGITQHLDGVFALAPDWTSGAARAAAAGRMNEAAALQQKLSALLRLMREFGLFQTLTTLLNARGIPGNYAPAPMRPLGDDRRDILVSQPLVAELIAAASTTNNPSTNGNGDFAASAATTTIAREYSATRS